MIEIKVVDSLHAVMFIAKVNEGWVHVLTMRDLVKPYIKNATKVAAGTGNGGDNKEYEVEYDGYYVTWDDFSSVGNEAN